MAKRLALFIGNSVYEDATLTRLKTPAADVRSFASALRDPRLGQFDEVQELIDQSEAIVRRAIADFFHRRHPEDLLLLYFSGHGVKDDRGRLYLAVRDTDYQRLSATAIASAYVVEHMDECRSKRQILILDCCNSGAFARGTKGDSTAMTADMFAGNGYGRVVLTASDSAQYALEGDRMIERAELSLFTHYLLEGLVTGAASDEPMITLDALYDYAYGRIVSTTPTQTPRKWVYNQQGVLIIACNPAFAGTESSESAAGERGIPAAASGSSAREYVPPPRPERTSPDLDLAKAMSTLASSAPLARVEHFIARLSLRTSWILAATVALALTALIAGSILRLDPRDIVARMIGGVIEGALLGGAFYLVLRNHSIDVDARRFLLAILVTNVLRWMVPLNGWPNASAGAVLFKGTVDGLLTGSAFVWVFSLRGRARALWYATAVVGWTLAAAFFDRAFTATFPTYVLIPRYPMLVLGAVNGLLLGALTALALPSLPAPANASARATASAAWK